MKPTLHVEGSARLEHTAELLRLQKLSPDCLQMDLFCPELALATEAGQFVNLESSRFLRRPFAVSRRFPDEGFIRLGIRLLGAGTRAYEELLPGARLSILGPLGRGFHLHGLRRVFLLGGGTGIFPLLSVLDDCRRLGIESFCALGFRNASQLVLEQDFRDAAEHFALATEDGSRGMTGYAQDALEKLWAEAKQKRASDSSAQPLSDAGNDGGSAQAEVREADGEALLCCGPLPLMERACVWASQHGLPTQVSMEARMACGFGLCRGCAIPMRLPDGAKPEATYERYSRCCAEGPVYRGESVDWEALNGK